jgi:biopolymer transport protein TolR
MSRFKNNNPQLFPGLLGIANSPAEQPGLQKWSPFDRLRKRKQRRAEYFCKIDVTALASVFVVLLFIFMNGNPIHDLPGNAVDLTRSKNSVLEPAARREDALRVSVTRSGQLYFGYLRVVQGELPGLIRERLRDGAEHRVYIFADARAKYGDVLTTLEAVKQAEVEHITFITEPPRR